MSVHEAFLAKLRSNPRLADIVFDSDADMDDQPRPVPFVVVLRDNGDRTDPTPDQRLDFRQRATDYEFQVQCVSNSPTAAGNLALEVTATVLNQRLAVDGASTWPVRQVESNQIERDRTVTPNQWYSDDTYAVRTTPK
ncbi:hypothetical protein ACF1AJ_20450 [Leifsonia sp. NPDC014704]|uniref:hypothetical protein n=1 Tax=Leifsonia sp. NPDC014704 TaxID=3364123 RepID=UPI0036F46F9D